MDTGSEAQEQRMLSGTRMRSAMLIAAAVGAIALPQNRGTAADAFEGVYLHYQQAIHAEAVCKQRDFGTDDDTRLASYIEGKVHHRVGPDKRLTLIEQARLEIDQLVEQRGCDSPEIGELLAVFQAELAPLLAE